MAVAINYRQSNLISVDFSSLLKTKKGCVLYVQRKQVTAVISERMQDDFQVVYPTLMSNLLVEWWYRFRLGKVLAIAIIFLEEQIFRLIN
jgi:hypothetical protein